MPARIYETHRVCEVCGAWFLRKRSKTGALEILKQFNRRRFCDVACKNKSQQKRIPPRYCKQCGDVLVRRRMPSRLEEARLFRRRKFCGYLCAALYHETRLIGTMVLMRSRVAA